jgi:hypothetical protein
MTAPGIIDQERCESLDAFEEIFANLRGVTEEHVATLRKATTTMGGADYPPVKDPLAQAAYTAAALRGLAEAVAVLQKEKVSKK